MNKNILCGITLVATLTLGAAGWWLLPSLQSAKRTVEQNASTETERARRLLHQYNASLNYKARLSDQLGLYVEEIDPDNLSEDLEDEYQRIHENIWESYQPMDWDRGRPQQANYGNVARQIREGVREQAGTVARNERLLDEALTAVDRALATRVGDESARSHPAATRLKAVVLYHKGLARWTEAQILRREAFQVSRELANLARDTANAVAASSRIGESHVEDEIENLGSRVDDLEANIDEHTGKLEAIEDAIDDLESRLTDAEVRRAEARRAIERLKAYGVDPSDPDGANRFERELATLGKLYRGADREAQAFEFGTYPTARLDLGGDYLTGRYVEADTQAEPTIQYGLVHYRDRHRTLSETLRREEQELDELGVTIAGFEAMREGYELAESRATERARLATEAGSEAFTELNRLESEAFAIEEDALDFLDKSASAAENAAGFARSWVNDARSRTQDLSPEAKGRSAFDQRSNSGWMAAYTTAQEADARLAKAWIHYARFRASTHNARTLTRIAETLQLNEADAESEKIKAQLAHDVGVAEITQAMSVLEKAHKKTGRHWTLTAQAASTTYLLALFGHDDFVADAIQSYRNAVTGRETESFAATFVTRLHKLENR